MSHWTQAISLRQTQFCSDIFVVEMHTTCNTSFCVDKMSGKCHQPFCILFVGSLSVEIWYVSISGFSSCVTNIYTCKLIPTCIILLHVVFQNPCYQYGLLINTVIQMIVTQFVSMTSLKLYTSDCGKYGKDFTLVVQVFVAEYKRLHKC